MGYSARTSGFLLIALTMLAKPAHADYQGNEAAVQCDSAHDRLLIRFGLFDGMPGRNGSLPAPTPTDSFLSLMGLPVPLANKWSKIPYQDAGTCRVKIGQKVVISEVDGTWGSGPLGAAVSGAFSMTINGYTVYTKVVFNPGYQEGGWSLSNFI
jgi:hypothetical protein